MRGKTNISGNGENGVFLNGDIKQFQIADKNNIIAGDFIQLTGEVSDFKTIGMSINQFQEYLEAENGTTINVQCSQSKNITFIVLQTGKEIGRYDFDVFDFSGILSMQAQIVKNTIYISWIYPDSSGKVTSKDILIFNIDDNNQITYKKIVSLDFSAVSDQIETNHETIVGKMKIYDNVAYVFYFESTTISKGYAYEGKTYLVIFDMDEENFTYRKHTLIDQDKSSFFDYYHLYINEFIFAVHTSHGSQSTINPVPTSPWINLMSIDGTFLYKNNASWLNDALNNFFGIYYHSGNLFVLDGTQNIMKVYDVQSDGKIFELSNISIKFETNNSESNGFKIISYNEKNYFFLIFGIITGASVARGARIIRYDANTLSFYDEYGYPLETIRGINSDYFYSFIEKNGEKFYQYLSVPKSTNPSLKIEIDSQSFFINNNIVELTSELNLIKNWDGTINGVALQSGTGGEIIDVSVPKKKL